jgi:nucleotide-binding universal stress UspA family protein
VVDDDQPERLQVLETEEALRILKNTKQDVPELTGVRIDASVVKGEPFEGILSAGREIGADLIVIGSHRRRLLRDVFVGTTAERIMRRGSLPVLMVNKPAVHPYHRIIVAVDLSASSSRALSAAKELGIFSGAQVFVLHAFDAMLTTLASASVSQEKIQEHLNDATLNARRNVEKFLASVDLTGVKYSVIVQEGGPVHALKNALADLHADLVVLGTRGRTGGIVKFLLGSVAEEAIRELDVDVLAVPPTEE